METIDILASVIQELQADRDYYQCHYWEEDKALDQANSRVKQVEAELIKKNDIISELEDQLSEALETIEGKIAKVGISSRDCVACGRDTYEQQQNYERIKEQLSQANEDLQKKAKELQFSLDCSIAREKSDWSWRESALKAGKELKEMEKEMTFWKHSSEAANAVYGVVGQEMKLLQGQLHNANETIEILRAELKPYREFKLQEITQKIEMEHAGRARR